MAIKESLSFTRTSNRNLRRQRAFVANADVIRGVGDGPTLFLSAYEGVTKDADF